MKATSIVIILVSTWGCNAKPEHSGHSSLRNIFGEDQRVDMDGPTGPWAAVGRLDGGCSATLVAPNLVLSAAHCLVDENGVARAPSFIFRAGFSAGQARIKTDVLRAWYGTNHPDDERGRDWAILELAANVSETPMVIDPGILTDHAALPITVSLAGYSGDRHGGTVLSLHESCAVRARDGERWLHDCDSWAGISGAPLVSGADRKIVAITVSEYRHGATTSVVRDAYDDAYANVAISASSFAAPLAKLIATVGRGTPAPELPGVLQVENPHKPGGDDPLGRLPDYSWQRLDSFPVPMASGRNAFDLAASPPFQYNRLKLAFSPDSCARISDLAVGAITVPDANVWEQAQLFDGFGAALTREEFSALRVAYRNDGAAQPNCTLTVYGATGALRSPIPIVVQPYSGNWYCQAAPYGDGSQRYGWWLSSSVDYSRYQALSYCTGLYGAICLVSCEKRG